MTKYKDLVYRFWDNWFKCSNPIDKVKLVEYIAERVIETYEGLKDNKDLAVYAVASLLNTYFEDLTEYIVQRCKDQVR